jgi:type IV pilus assembly protein PilB
VHVQTGGPFAPGTGRAGFPALLLDRGLISRSDLATAQQQADREQIELSEALVALGLVPEVTCYALLAEATGLELVDLSAGSSELAVRLVPERLARRYTVVPLSVDNRTLTYATSSPFDPEVERDLSFASGRRMQPTVARRSVLLEALERCYPKLRDLDVLAARLSGERPIVETEGAAGLDPTVSTVIDSL